MKPKIRFKTGTVGSQRLVAYIIDVNDGWYTNAQLLTKEQRKMMVKSKALRNLFKHALTQKFWRYLGAA